MFTEIEQATLDIDWFFTNGNEVGFVASGGGKLPDVVSKKSTIEIEILVEYFRCLPKSSVIIINPDLQRLIAFRGAEIDQYLSCFVEMAEKGLFCFDKTILNKFSDLNYHLVAKPLNPLSFNELPAEISKLISDTRISGDIGNSLEINSFMG
jgi:hypothetical protein